MKRFDQFIPWASTIVALMSIGCGLGASPSSVPVSGQIFIDGKPLAGAEVQFLSEDKIDFGLTDSDGRYELGHGAFPGLNRVTVTKWEGDHSLYETEGTVDAGQLQAAASAASMDHRKRKVDQEKTPKQMIPPKYSHPQKTVLSIDVPSEGLDEADFQLTAK